MYNCYAWTLLQDGRGLARNSDHDQRCHSLSLTISASSRMNRPDACQRPIEAYEIVASGPVGTLEARRPQIYALMDNCRSCDLQDLLHRSFADPDPADQPCKPCEATDSYNAGILCMA